MLIIQVTIWLDHNVRMHQNYTVDSVREIRAKVTKDYGKKTFRIDKIQEAR
jgi:hypothetical protein